MKSVILIRHAKSNWENPGQIDFDRPLNERGHRDAPDMAARLKTRVPVINLFVSSPANRALSTAVYFANTYDTPITSISLKQELYHARPHIFYDVIAGIDNRCNTIALFSHNGGITDFVNGLTDTKVDNMPTCAAFAVRADIADWKDFFESLKSFWFFDYPKMKAN